VLRRQYTIECTYDIVISLSRTVRHRARRHSLEVCVGKRAIGFIPRGFQEIPMVEYRTPRGVLAGAHHLPFSGLELV